MGFCDNVMHVETLYSRNSYVHIHIRYSQALPNNYYNIAAVMKSVQSIDMYASYVFSFSLSPPHCSMPTDIMLALTLVCLATLLSPTWCETDSDESTPDRCQGKEVRYHLCTCMNRVA